MININKLEFEKFKDDLSILSEESSSQKLLDIIKKFLRSNEEFFSEKPYIDYKLLGFLDYNDDEYPINYSSLNKSEIIVFKKIINSYKYNEGENITRFLRDTLERLYYFEVDEICKNCGAYGLIAVDPSRIQFTVPVVPKQVYNKGTIADTTTKPTCGNCKQTWPTGTK